MTSSHSLAVGTPFLNGEVFTHIQMCVRLITRLLQLVGRLDTRKQGYHTSLMVVATKTDRLKSVRNGFEIKVLVAFVHCRLAVRVSVVIGTFVIALSQISFFFSIHNVPPKTRENQKLHQMTKYKRRQKHVKNYKSE